MRYIVLFFLLLPSILFAQIVEIDSLKFLLNRPDDSLKAVILIDIYENYEQGKVLLGKEYLDQALELTNDLGEVTLKATVLLKYSNFYIITGDFEKAINYANKAKEFCEDINYFKGTGKAYNNLGATYEKLGKYDEAMDNLIKALNIYETIDDSSNIARTYLNLGLLYSRQEDYIKSLELYNKSLEIRKKLDDKAGIALLYNNMAIVNYYLEDYDNVRSYFEKSYEMYVEIGNLRRQLMALSNLAEINNIIGQKEKALVAYFKILELEKELGHKGELSQTHILIGQIYQSRDDFYNSKKHYNLSLKIAQEIDAIVDIRDVYGQLAEIYKIEKNFEKALEYNEMYAALNDSIFNSDKSRQIKEIETQYETKKKEQQIANLENEKIIKDFKIKKQRNFSIFLIAGFIFVLSFLLILFAQIKRIRKANSILTYQKKQITESIEYASRIQTAILPPGDYITRVIPEHFIVYKPRDIVSGDFYWITHKDGKTIVAAVDCTGHGVPGAFMSMLGFAFLNEIVNTNSDLNAGAILDQLRDYVKKSLHQTGKKDEAKDGMDIALCIIDAANGKLQYSGAYNPLYLIRNNDFISLKADRMPIGIHIIEKESFTNHELEIQKGDVIYIFTDGYIDQFGGPESKKYRLLPFKEMLMQITNKPMNEQKEILETEFAKWKGKFEQIDDVLVMGIKI
ncbi:MAG: tetratricopeptide repeat protein [Bacteroidales bacterium]|jgi:serine phosphatase RsbU (regulator of sigma subunit)|nr:tetratricopeptide repeat protein [Bacteroidales bacterium]